MPRSTGTLCLARNGDLLHYVVGGYRHHEHAAELAALVSRHFQVVRLLCGHVHCWHRETWGGTLATTMPSIAVDLRKGVDAGIGVAPFALVPVARRLA